MSWKREARSEAINEDETIIAAKFETGHCFENGEGYLVLAVRDAGGKTVNVVLRPEMVEIINEGLTKARAVAEDMDWEVPTH